MAPVLSDVVRSRFPPTLSPTPPVVFVSTGLHALLTEQFVSGAVLLGFSLVYVVAVTAIVPRQLEVNALQIVITAGLTWVVPLKDIARVEIAAPFSCDGWPLNTCPNHTVRLTRTEGRRPILISPANPEGFVAAVHLAKENVAWDHADDQVDVGF